MPGSVNNCDLQRQKDARAAERFGATPERGILGHLPWHQNDETVAAAFARRDRDLHILSLRTLDCEFLHNSMMRNDPKKCQKMYKKLVRPCTIHLDVQNENINPRCEYDKNY